MLILRDDNPSIWCEYRAGVRARIKPIDKTTMRALRKKATRIEFVNRQRQEVVDDGKFDRLVTRAAIEEWEGVVDSAGQAIPCSDENKDRIANRMINFSAWVIDEAMSLADAEDAQLDTDIKN